ncbi:hypothetical protein ACTFIU_000755 [Dictyostelium citrinum]
MVTKQQLLDEIQNATDALIEHADKNGDGQLSKNEVLEMLIKGKCKKPAMVTKSMFQLYDENKDGKLSASEIDVMLLVDYIISAETAIKYFVDEIFKADKNKDNKISKNEAKRSFIDSGSKEKDATLLATSMFEDVDTDNDNFITRDEVRQFAINYYEIYPTE